MQFKNYNIKETKKGLLINDIQHFNLAHIFECGQCFRWNKQGDGTYRGVVKNKLLKIKQHENGILFLNSNIEDFQKVWYDYFDLGRDYSKIIKGINIDETMKKAIDFGYGIRILKQDFWETLISFIISANNMIPRIMRSIQVLSKTFGDRIISQDEEFYTFPNIARILNADVNQIRETGVGFRAKYILDTAKQIGDLYTYLENLKLKDTDNARKELMKLTGVGPKVADCVLLFSGLKFDVFPIDVWVKRVMGKLYFKKEVNLKEIQKFAREHFGDLTGFAQQYLFYYARSNIR